MRGRLLFTVFLCLSTTLLSEGHFNYKSSLGRLEVYLQGRKILEHSEDSPALKVGHGNSRYESQRGNFEIKETLTSEVELTQYSIDETTGKATTEQVNGTDNTVQGNPFIIHFLSDDGTEQVSVEFSRCDPSNEMCTSYTRREKIDDLHYIKVLKSKNSQNNRLWIRFYAEKEEHLYGGGEQFSYFSLRGRSYPMWVREQGVGRNHSTVVTKMADLIAGAGGDYHTTYWPQATFVSDRLFYTHLDYNHYSVLNFSSSTHNEIEMWEEFTDATFYMETAGTWHGVLEKLTSFFGRQPLPPAWLYNGAIIGLQGGTEKVVERYRTMKDQGIKVSAIWIQDWSGNYFTDLGSRVYWNWRWDQKFYPNLDKVVQEFSEKEEVKFLTYINPHLITESEMFKEADEKGYLIRDKNTGKSLIIDFEMDCGTVDLTNPEAYEWYKTVLKDMLKLGFGGWMADFGGEYLIVDNAVYHSGEDPSMIHNKYSELWAKLNREAVEEEGKMAETFLFFRSGFGKVPGYIPMAWAGDQNSDFSYGDGLASTIPAALSLGMSGMGMSHSDIGGYVSAMCMVRTQELFLRWAEMSVFTPVMRTHEGNRPKKNWQLYTSEKTLSSFARLSQIYVQLSRYHTHVARENTRWGLPAQRPLFLSFPDDEHTYDIKYQYMYGSELLVAPVLFEGVTAWSVYLPVGVWTYMWNGTTVDIKPYSQSPSYKGANVIVNTEVMGFPPVFYRAKQSAWTELFSGVGNKYGYKNEMKNETEYLSFNLLMNDPLLFWYLLLRKIFWYLFFNV